MVARNFTIGNIISMSCSVLNLLVLCVRFFGSRPILWAMTMSSILLLKRMHSFNALNFSEIVKTQHLAGCWNETRVNENNAFIYFLIVVFITK